MDSTKKENTRKNQATQYPQGQLAMNKDVLRELEDIVEADYSDSLICWVDLLGFSDWVNGTRKEKCQDPKVKVTMLRNLFVGAKKLMMPWKDQPPQLVVGTGVAGIWHPNYRYTHFSDTIVISTGHTNPDGAKWLCDRALALAVYLTQNKMPFRGAILQGELYHSQSNVFGPAVVDAHYLETKCANYPRIVISPELVARFNSNPEPWDVCGRYFMQDSDLLYYLDYVDKIWETSRGAVNIEERLKTLQSIYEMSVEGQKNPSISVVMKYNWLANKYDDYIRSLRYMYDDHQNKQINPLPLDIRMLLTTLRLISPRDGEEKDFHL